MSLKRRGDRTLEENAVAGETYNIDGEVYLARLAVDEGGCSKCAFQRKMCSAIARPRCTANDVIFVLLAEAVAMKLVGEMS